jgi:Carboxypeptidase regulatory-like domain
MEEPGFVKICRHLYFKIRRTKFVKIIFVLLIIIVFLLYINQEKKMENRGTIKGILQNTSGQPIADAVVMIKEGSAAFNDIASVSNEQGEFFVSGIVIPGRYVLQIQHENGTITKEINVSSADTILQISF